MNIFDTLKKEMFEYKKSHNESLSGIISLVITDISNEKIEKQRELTEDEMLVIIKRYVKRLTEAYNQYISGGREDLAKVEKEQREYLEKYLPVLMSEEEVRVKIKEIISSLNLAKPNVGSVMGPVMQQLKGKADGALVNKLVAEYINGNTL